MSSGFVTKNSEELPSTPLLAIANRPLEVNRRLGFNSTGIVVAPPIPLTPPWSTNELMIR